MKPRVARASTRAPSLEQSRRGTANPAPPPLRRQPCAAIPASPSLRRHPCAAIPIPFTASEGEEHRGQNGRRQVPTSPALEAALAGFNHERPHFPLGDEFTLISFDGVLA